MLMAEKNRRLSRVEDQSCGKAREEKSKNVEEDFSLRSK
jgi:hypothetical protein